MPSLTMEQNAYPDRLDLRDQHLRMAKAKGVKFIINTDAHHTSHMEKIRYGVLQLRRAWLTKQDVLNTLPVTEFATIVRRGRPVLAEINGSAIKNKALKPQIAGKARAGAKK